MTEKKVRKVLREHGYRVLKISDVPESNSIFALVFDGNSVKELYVCPDYRHASLQTLSSVCIHKGRDVSDWFDFN